MKELEDRIRKDGLVLEGDILKVDSFLNHQIDVRLCNAMGKEFKRLFADRPITKILTVEASGICIAAITAQYFDVPMVFAKKNRTSNLDSTVYSSRVPSYTHGNINDIMVSRRFLSAEDHVLIIDDFLAHGNATNGLIDLCNQAGATVEGVGIMVEKGYQKGGSDLRSRGYNLHSLAIVSSMDPKTGSITFRQED